MLTTLLANMLGTITTDVANAQSFASPLKPVYESDAMKMSRVSGDRAETSASLRLIVRSEESLL